VAGLELDERAECLSDYRVEGVVGREGVEGGNVAVDAVLDHAAASCLGGGVLRSCQQTAALSAGRTRRTGTASRNARGASASCGARIARAACRGTRVRVAAAGCQKGSAHRHGAAEGYDTAPAHAP